MESISIPDTPAGRQVGEWLDCLESGELDRRRDFAARHYSAAALDRLDAEARAALDLGVVYRDTRGLVPEQVQRKSETELRLLVRARPVSCCGYTWPWKRSRRSLVTKQSRVVIVPRVVRQVYGPTRPGGGEPVPRI